jgi:effector-binding domain-containing protein
MATEPVLVDRPEQPYVAVTGRVTLQTFAAVADRLPGVFGWLAARGVEPAGAPFFKYNLVDMERQMEIEAGVPVAAPIPGGAEVHNGVLPAGRYAAVTHVGPPDQLVAVTAALLDWADQHSLTWDMSETPDGQRWACRLELLKTNPAEVPDPNHWETELAFRLAD